MEPARKINTLTALRDAKERKREGGTPPYLHAAYKELMASQKPGKLLDCLAFRGEQSKIMKNLGFQVTACDLYPESFEEEGIECLRADLDKQFPFGEDEFDYVLLSEAIEHLESPWHVVREAYRVLKPGGLLVLSTPNTLSLLSRFLFFSQGVFLYFSEFEFHKPAHINPMTYNELKLIFEEVGFDISEVIGTGHKIPRFALWCLRILQFVCGIISEIAFSLLCLYTKQSKPRANSLLDRTLTESQGIIIAARKKG